MTHCTYPDCNCPFDAPADPGWCARGLPKSLEKVLTNLGYKQTFAVEMVELLKRPAVLPLIPAVKALREENERLSRERDMFEQSVAHWKKAYREDTETLRDSKECALAQLHEVVKGGKNLSFMAQTTGGGPDEKLMEAINSFAKTLELGSVAEAHRQHETQRERIAELEAKCDSLMLEFCPDEMTAEQLQEWGMNQVPESQLAELRQGGEAVVWIASDDLRQLRENPGKREVIAVFARKECSVGPTSPLFTHPQPAIPPGYAVVKSELFEAVAALVRFAGDWNQGTHAKLYRPVICRLVGEHIASAPATQPQAAAPSAPVAEQDWLPIETAPRDGTEIIALDAYSYRNDPKRRMHFVLRSVFFNDEGGWEISEDGEILDEDALTHWLPRSALPASPVAFAAPADSKEGEK